ncbi:thioredoxin [Candidatus Woesearchaeota archaeon]|nr:thioredoxin [Candidatus Woesearchaeota archaeon]
MIKSYKMFTTPTCHACPMVKEFMEGVEIEGEHINAASPEGAKEAQKYGITAVPTVVFFDEKEELFVIARSINEIKRALE